MCWVVSAGTSFLDSNSWTTSTDVIFAFNCLKAGHWVRVHYDIMSYRIHELIIVQCQCDCCCLSSKDGTVILLFGSLLDSWRQVVSPFWKWRLLTAAAPTLFCKVYVDAHIRITKKTKTSITAKTNHEHALRFWYIICTTIYMKICKWAVQSATNRIW